MATFTPPTVDGNPMAFTGKDDAANRLFRFYGAWATGQTVWLDQDGVWHRSLEPYQGGVVHWSWDNGVGTATEPDEGLATAQVVYHGGHTYEITPEEEAALIDGGFGEYIEP